MKQLLIILIFPIIGLSQQIQKAPYSDRDWYLYKKSDLTVSWIEQPEEWVIDAYDYHAVVHGSTTILLREAIDSITNRSFDDYTIWETALSYSMYLFHPEHDDIIVSEYFNDEEENCGCVDQLLDELFDNENIIYGDMTIGDMLKSNRLKEYAIVFYNTIHYENGLEIYQQELVIYYKAKFNPLIKSQRKTRKLTYMIPFKEVVIDKQL